MAIKSVILTAGFAALAQAFHQPGAQTYGALTRPDGSHPVTQGQSYSVTWQQPSGAPAGQTVSLVLCNGPGANCVIQSSAIVENVPASQNSYTWSVPCSLPVGQANTATGYGMLIIVDQTGEFQFEAGSSCGSSGSTTTSSSSGGSTTTSSSSSTTSQSSSPQSTTSNWSSWNSTTTAGASSTPWSTYTQSSAATATGQVTSTTKSTAPTSTFTGGAIQTAVNVAGALGAVGLALFAM